MIELERCCCPNSRCKDYGLSDQGNIGVRGKYGKDRNRVLLYCRTCGRRFASTQASAMFGLHITPEEVRRIIDLSTKGKTIRTIARKLNLDKDTVNRAILRSHEHCTDVLTDLLTSLEMDNTQLKDLLAFVKKRKILSFQKETAASKNEGVS